MHWKFGKYIFIAIVFRLFCFRFSGTSPSWIYYFGPCGSSSLQIMAVSCSLNIIIKKLSKTIFFFITETPNISILRYYWYFNIYVVFGSFLILVSLKVPFRCLHRISHGHVLWKLFLYLLLLDSERQLFKKLAFFLSPSPPTAFCLLTPRGSSVVDLSSEESKSPIGCISFL